MTHLAEVLQGKGGGHTQPRMMAWRVWQNTLNDRDLRINIDASLLLSHLFQLGCRGIPLRNSSIRGGVLRYHTCCVGCVNAITRVKQGGVLCYHTCCIGCSVLSHLSIRGVVCYCTRYIWGGVLLSHVFIQGVLR